MRKILMFTMAGLACLGAKSDGDRTGALDAGAWDSSEWISVKNAPLAGEDARKRQRAADGTSVFWRRVKNARKVKSAKWMTTGLGVYELYLNGRCVGSDFLKPGFTHVRKTRRSFTYDVTGLLKCGAGESNDFGAEVSAGWWSDKIVNYAGKKPALRCVIELVYADGGRELVGSKASEWFGEVAGPVKHAGIFDGEEYDARETNKARSPSGDFAPSGCEANTEFKGEILPTDGAEITLRTDLADMGMVRKGTFSVTPGNPLVLDFGQNCAAVPRFRFRAKRGTVLTALPGEMLNDADKGQRGCDGPKGSVYRENLRNAANGMRVVYTFGGGDWEVYSPRFSFFGYRYISISATDAVEIERVASVPVTSITPEMQIGHLETGVPELNRFVSNVFWGQLSNYLSVPTDCPQRNERLGWMADTQVFTEAGAFNADTRRFFRKWMRDVRDSVDDRGGYPSVAPCGQYGNGTFKFGWADAGVIVPWTIWKMFGDKAIVDENFDAMARFVKALDETKYDFEGKGDYNYADWLSYEKFESCGNRFGGWGKWGKDPDAMNYRRFLAACYWLYDAKILSDMAAATGRGEDAAWFRGSACRAKDYILSKFVDTDGLLLKPMRDLQTACVFALHFGIVDGAARTATLELLKKNIREHGDCLQTGFLGTSFLMDALAECGEIELCYTLLLQRKNPSWLYSVDQGATTIWERWNSYTVDNGFGPVEMNSFNHYAYGQVLGWIYRTVAGIAADPAAPGFRNIVMAPKPDPRLGSVKAVYRSAAGTISSEWKYEGKRWTWNFTVPAGATAAVTVPGEKESRRYTSGKYRIEK
ncbi:MAG: family 78 glycoside hydrolase catalytic domain [Kiritimatiellae bacterium]|nr:family 78 glycoside hydrolase catalytic domain [Kiritimatiellia bacterium]